MAKFRPIKSDLKSKRTVFEEEKPIRWSFIKYLREYSTLKEFYPEINPYAEAYKVRDNTWAIFVDGLGGAGDPWMFVIDGPEKALVVDTGFGLGDLLGLAKKLVGSDKEIIACNTHSHPDHCLGNAQFEKVYCHKDEEYLLRKTMNPNCWDWILDENGNPKGAEFDVNDMVPYKDYELITLNDNECIDLGDGYLVECIPLRGHAPGNAGWLDKQTGCFFIGDVTNVGGARDLGDPNLQNYTVERLQKDFEAVCKRLDEISGVFPGHGMLDQTPIMLQYELDTLNAVMANPENYDYKKTMNFGQMSIDLLQKNIYQGTAIRYKLTSVYMNKEE